MHAKSAKYFNRKSITVSFDYVIFALGWQYGLYSVFVLVIFREYVKYIVPISVLNFLFKYFPDNAVHFFKICRYDILIECFECEVNFENKIARSDVVLGITRFH